MPADRSADHPGERRADSVGAAGQVAVVKRCAGLRPAEPAQQHRPAMRLDRLGGRDGCRFPLGHGGGGASRRRRPGGPGAGPTGAGGTRGTVVGGPIGIVMPGATSIVG